MRTATEDTDWSKPQAVTDLDTAFGGSLDRLMPAYESIPAEFRDRDNTKWHKAQSKWFYEGIKASDFKPKDGIDPTQALRHLKCIQGSFEPKHEHKMAAVAWLMSLWFDDVTACR
jgi:hypothetical protein